MGVLTTGYFFFLRVIRDCEVAYNRTGFVQILLMLNLANTFFSQMLCFSMVCVWMFCAQ
jgi:hypothetical protein